jgi:hypothetical protein
MSHENRSVLAITLLAGATLFVAQTASAATVCCSCKGPPDAAVATCLQIESDKLGSETDCSKLKDAATLPGTWTCDAAAISADACVPVSGGKGSAKCIVGPKSVLEVGGTAAAPAAAPEQAIIPLDLNTPIPGLTINAVSSDAFGRYVAGAYRYGISIVAIAATVMFTFGAFLYLLGSAITSIEKGKQYMFDAIIGLLLVMGASFILRTLNPETVELNLIQVEAIKAAAAANESVTDPSTRPDVRGTAKDTAQFQSFSASELAGSTPTPAESGAVPQPLKVPALKQYLGPWANVAYGPNGLSACPGSENRPSSVSNCCTTYWRGGCGPTSLATLLKFNGIAADPAQAGEAIVAGGGRICNNGTIFSKSTLDQISKSYPGYKLVSVGPGKRGLDASIKALRSGQPVMFLCAGCEGKNSKGEPRGYKGHYMVLTGVDENGVTFSVSDVGNDNPRALVSIADTGLLGKVGGYWYLQKE